MMAGCSKGDCIMQVVRIFVHLLAASMFAYSVYYDWNFVVIPPEVSPLSGGYGGKFKYLTFWDAVIQTLFFTLCVFNDFLGSNDIDPKPKPLLRKIKDYVQVTIEFPVAMFVGITFWALYAVDRELVFPTAIDPYFPNWLNHVMHTNIVGFAALEMAITCRRYPNRSKGLTGLLGFMLVYLSWVFVIYNKSGRWVYPVLAVLNWVQKGIFFLVLLLLVTGLYLLGEQLNNSIWAKHLKLDQSPKKSAKKVK
ncbi:androgen-induced gene 1 protein-like [Neocloeon triangulifer]|uniref:androgen-induced gene 1 protein-like n=1 Tax=Neocloeon triangulifer TaxID=2078957 RepID=UPI00286F61A1|nr:androgen-induced gene 1 protein-like [Neocloeon triangulifer]